MLTVLAGAYKLPDFSWDVVPRFVHCGPTLKHYPTADDRVELYNQLSKFPLVTLEKFTWQQEEPASQHEGKKILEAAKEIRARNTSTKIIYYHMAWQDFSQYDLYNETLDHAHEGWTVSWDNGSIPGIDVPGRCTYNLSHAPMRAAWVAELQSAFASGLIDGFFIDITPQALPNVTDPSDPDDGTVDYAKNVKQLCSNCSAPRLQQLLDGLDTALKELAESCPDAIIICNPTDYGACNTHFFEYFGSSADHGRSVVGDFHILQNKYELSGHMVQARAATFNKSTVFHMAEFLVGAGNYTYFGASHFPGWGCTDGWLETGVPSDAKLFDHPLGTPDGPYNATPNGAPVVPNTTTPGMVYTRSFGNGQTTVWLNLTDGNLWKHAKACTRHPWPAKPECPQVCIRWGDGAVTAWPEGFDKNCMSWEYV